VSERTYEAIIWRGTQKAMLLAFDALLTHKIKLLSSSHARGVPFNKKSITLLIELPEGMFPEFIESRSGMKLTKWTSPRLPANRWVDSPTTDERLKGD
jgi:hypothetical protein